MKKEGLTWIGKRTGQYRYSVGGADQWLHPLSIYIAGEDIQRGHVVSIALSQDFQGDSRVVAPMLSSDDNLIVKTRTNRHLKACGIAMESVSAGNPVHILDSGRMRFSMLTGEYFPSIVDSDRGKLLYVSATPGEMTLDRDAAVLGSRNLIQIGMISETTLAANPPYFDVEVQFEGDGRGPLEATQFEVAFGEPYSYSTVAGKLPVRAFAIGKGEASIFQYRLTCDRPNVPFPSLAQGNLNTWIAIYSSWFAHIIIFGSSEIPQSTTQGDIDRLQYILQQAKTSAHTSLYPPGNTPPVTWGNPDTTQVDIYRADYPYFLTSVVNSLASLKSAAVFGPSQDTTFQTALMNVVLDDFGSQQQVSVTLSGTSAGGPVFIDWDSSLNAIFGRSAYEQQGSFNAAGRAVLADRRFADRSNVLGLLLRTTEHDYDEGETALFIRKGTFYASYDAFIPGETYYLGIDGQLTPFDSSFRYPDTITRVGIAKTTRRLIVDVGEASVARVAGMPIGGIKPVPAGVTEPEHGFVLMDGTTELESAFYKDLLQELLARYPSEDVYVNNPTTFKVPRLDNPATGNYYQIKATTYGYEPFLTSSTMKRGYGAVSADATADLDITDLSFAGPQGAFEDLTVDRLLPRLFVDVPAIGWREIPAGFIHYNGLMYGYTWNIVKQGPTYLLRMDISEGEGLAFFTSPTSSVRLNGYQYRLLVMKPDVFARYSEFDLDIAATTLSAITPTNNLPINSTAVSDYISNGMETQNLTVRNTTTLGTGLPATNDLVIVNANIVVNDNHSTGTKPTITIDSKSGLIETTAVMSPLGSGNTATPTSLVTKSYVDDHRSEISDSNTPVHGIRQGSGNGFDADTVDGKHATLNGVDGQIPTITTSSILRIGQILQLQIAGSPTTEIQSFSNAEVTIGPPSSYTGTGFSIGIGSGVGGIRRWIGNNNGTIEILSNKIVGTTYADIKAAQFRTASSGSLKENIKPFESALDIINATRVVTYNYIDQPEPQVGFIAEDTHELLAGTNHDAMNVSSTVGILLRAVQELSVENASLEKRIAALEGRI